MKCAKCEEKSATTIFYQGEKHVLCLAHAGELTEKIVKEM